MKHRIFSLILLLCLGTLLYAQKYNYQVPFGYGDNFKNRFGISILDFNNGKVTCYPYKGDKTFALGENSSFICDSSGQLLLITDNCTIRDKNLKIIPNADTLTPGKTWNEYCNHGGGYPSWQCDYFIPELSNDSVIYLAHHQDEISNTFQTVISSTYFLSVISRKVNGSFYLKQRDTIQYGTLMQPFAKTATKNANGDKWWTFTIDFNTNTFRFYEIGGKELISPPVLTSIGVSFNNKDLGSAYASFSPDGKTLAINYKYSIGVLLYDFDNKTGKLSNFRAIPYSKFTSAAEGVCFSPNGRFLYLTTGRHLFQMDLKATNPSDSVYYYGEIISYDEYGWPVGVGNMYLGPDCRIYVSPGSTTYYIHVIHHPNEKGEKSMFEERAIKAPSRMDIGFGNTVFYNASSICDSTISWGIVAVQEKGMHPYKMVVSPNPTTDHLTIEVTLPHYDEKTELVLCDLTGKELIKTTLPDYAYIGYLDVSQLSAGMYILQLRQRGRVLKTEKVVVVR